MLLRAQIRNVYHLLSKIKAWHHDARPLFWTEDDIRFGFEPEVAQAIAIEMGEELQWVFLKWVDFSTYLLSGKADGIMCGSAITPEREKQFLYSKPYAYFNESVLIRSGTDKN